MSDSKLSSTQTLLRAIIEEDCPEDIKRDNFFETFAISQVLKNFKLTNDDIDYGHVGGAQNGGCDGLYLFLNDSLLYPDQLDKLPVLKKPRLKLYIIQAKNEFGFKEQVFSNWKTVSSNLMTLSSFQEYSGRYNEQIIDTFKMLNEVIQKLKREELNLSIEYYYISMAEGNINPNVQAQAEELKKIIRERYPSAETRVSFIDADQLWKIYHASPETRTTLEFVTTPSYTDSNCAGLVNLANYYRFITDESSGLQKNFFEANVRDYQGNNVVNSGIAKTLEASNTGEDFWWFNNGVTILTSGITPLRPDCYQLIDPEIVNGLQTSREIFNFYSQHPDAVKKEKRNLLVRVINPNNEESRNKIILATNKQTNIPNSYLRVTDPIHLKIEQYFRTKGLCYDRRKNYYKNLKEDPSTIVTVPFLAQCLISLLLRQPDFARARPSTLLDRDEIYKKLYNEETPLEVFYKAAYIGKRIKSHLRATTYSPTIQNDLLFCTLHAVVANHIKKKDISINDLINLDTLADNEIKQIEELVYKQYEALGSSSTIAKSPTFIEKVESALEI